MNNQTDYGALLKNRITGDVIGSIPDWKYMSGQCIRTSNPLSRLIWVATNLCCNSGLESQ